MGNELIPIEIRGIMPTAGGCAIFLKTNSKAFVIHVDFNMGQTIAMYLQHVAKDRPLTHDLIGTIFVALNITVERIIINDIQGSTFYARIILQMKNELGTKMIELDARPSDAIVLALQSQKPIYTTPEVLSKVEDVTERLNKLFEDYPPED